MPTLHRLLSLALLAGACAPMAAQATVLPFTSTFGAGGQATYGDRVTAPLQDGATYLEGGGWTPNVEIALLILSNANPPSIYPGGYASLLSALGHTAFNVPFRIDFVPDAGWQVTLRQFDIATWSTGSYATDIRIWDERGSFTQPNLWSFNSTLGPGQVYQPLAAAVTGVGTVSLYLSNLGSTGLDNIDFVQSAVPEPGALLLLALGLAGLRVQTLRRRV